MAFNKLFDSVFAGS